MTEMTSNAQAEESASTVVLLADTALPIVPGTFGRPWASGESGCPAGRRGIYPPEERYRRKASKHLPAITDMVIKKAKSGNLQAAALVYKYALAPPKEQAVVFDLPVGGTFVDQIRAVMVACAQGILVPSQASQILLALAANARAVEIDNNTRRVDNIEKLLERTTRCLRRPRNRVEDRLAAVEEQLAALRTRRLTYTERRVAQDLPDEERILRRLRRYDYGSDKPEPAWARLSVANKLKHKRRELGRLVAKWETRDEKVTQYAGRRVPWSVRLELSEGYYWNGRLSLEADILELEGGSAERISQLRWAANESSRRSERVSPDEYEKAHAPPPEPVAALLKEAREPREWRPKPKERDILADYRDQRLNLPGGPRSFEPDVV